MKKKKKKASEIKSQPKLFSSDQLESIDAEWDLVINLLLIRLYVSTFMAGILDFSSGQKYSEWSPSHTT